MGIFMKCERKMSKYWIFKRLKPGHDLIRFLFSFVCKIFFGGSDIHYGGQELTELVFKKFI